MKYVNLGSTDIKVSPLCLGTWQFNNGQQSADKTWPAQAEEVSKSILDKALELGINYIDTAEAYLNSEETLGRILAGRRKDVVLATKVGARLQCYTPEDIETSLATSLQRLQTDYIDLYQVHYAPFIADNLEACVAELNRQKAKGAIREWAVCNYGPQNIRDIIKAGGKPVTNQVAYNLLYRAVEREIQPLCLDQGIGLLPYSPLQQGLLAGKFKSIEDVPEGRRRMRLFNASSTSLSRHEGEGLEKQVFETLGRIAGVCEKAGISMPTASLSWLLQQGGVSSVIVGASSPDQVSRNVATVTLQQSVLEELNDVTSDMKDALGNNPDPWAKDSRVV